MFVHLHPSLAPSLPPSLPPSLLTLFDKDELPSKQRVVARYAFRLALLTPPSPIHLLSQYEKNVTPRTSRKPSVHPKVKPGKCMTFSCNKLCRPKKKKRPRTKRQNLVERGRASRVSASWAGREEEGFLGLSGWAGMLPSCGFEGEGGREGRREGGGGRGYV